MKIKFKSFLQLRQRTFRSLGGAKEFLASTKFFSKRNWALFEFIFTALVFSRFNPLYFLFQCHMATDQINIPNQHFFNLQKEYCVQLNHQDTKDETSYGPRSLGANREADGTNPRIRLR
jgi:hypothetical protein